MVHFGSPDAISDLVHFGMRHNCTNNYKSRIKSCAGNDSEHGFLVIDGKFVAESVKKYFGIDLENQTVAHHGMPFYFDGQL